MKQQQMSCRDIELLYRQRAVLDCEHSWKWLAEAERWEHLAQKETASRFKEIGPMAMGPNTINGDLRGKQMGNAQPTSSSDLAEANNVKVE
jgi:hypothetical protein